MTRDANSTSAVLMDQVVRLSTSTGKTALIMINLFTNAGCRPSAFGYTIYPHFRVVLVAFLTWLTNETNHSTSCQHLACCLNLYVCTCINCRKLSHNYFMFLYLYLIMRIAIMSWVTGLIIYHWKHEMWILPPKYDIMCCHVMG